MTLFKRSATELGGLSKVNETDISDVVTKSTLSSCLAIISNTFAKNPCAYIILGVLTVTMTCSLRRVMARYGGSTSQSRTMIVPPFSGSFDEPTKTLMSCLNAGSIVAGCNTFAPNVAISAASSKLNSGRGRALSVIRGSVVYTPMTSVQI